MIDRTSPEADALHALAAHLSKDACRASSAMVLAAALDIDEAQATDLLEGSPTKAVRERVTALALTAVADRLPEALERQAAALRALAGAFVPRAAERVVIGFQFETAGGEPAFGTSAAPEGTTPSTVVSSVAGSWISENFSGLRWKVVHEGDVANPDFSWEPPTASGVASDEAGYRGRRGAIRGRKAAVLPPLPVAA